MTMPARIYTRTGDAGETGLFGGKRLSKDDLRVEAYGNVDELNAILGAARAQGPDAELDLLLSGIQNDLFLLGADLATPTPEDTHKGRITIERVGAERTVALEQAIDHYEATLPSLTQFILPGGHPLAAALHVSRTVSRRAERRCVSLARATTDLNPEIVRYLNRLSDLLFVLARYANHHNGLPDVTWQPEKLTG